MSDNTFKKVGKTEKMLFGPRAILVCGYDPKEQQAIVEFIEALRIDSVPVIFAASDNAGAQLKELFTQPDQTGKDLPSDMDSAIILSGVAEKELHTIISSFKNTGLPRPLWATLTPISQDWPLDALIAELKKERAAMEARKR